MISFLIALDHYIYLFQKKYFHAIALILMHALPIPLKWMVIVYIYIYLYSVFVYYVTLNLAPSILFVILQINLTLFLYVYISLMLIHIKICLNEWFSLDYFSLRGDFLLLSWYLARKTYELYYSTHVVSYKVNCWGVSNFLLIVLISIRRSPTCSYHVAVTAFNIYFRYKYFCFCI